MQDPDIDSVPAGELAWCEAELPEWDRLRVQDYWDAVVAEELGAPEPPAFDWSELGSGERVRLRRYQPGADNTVLRLVTAAVEDPAVLDDEEAA